MPEGLSPEDDKQARDAFKLDNEAARLLEFNRNPMGLTEKIRQDNSEASAEHVAEHLPEYVETAKAEAGADGKEINLGDDSTEK